MGDKILDLDEEPPSKVNQDSLKLRISGSGDLYSAIFGCGVSPQSRYHFGSLAALGGIRRSRILEANQNNGRAQ